MPTAFRSALAGLRWRCVAAPARTIAVAWATAPKRTDAHFMPVACRDTPGQAPASGLARSQRSPLRLSLGFDALARIRAEAMATARGARPAGLAVRGNRGAASSIRLRRSIAPLPSIQVRSTAAGGIELLRRSAGLDTACPTTSASTRSRRGATTCWRSITWRSSPRAAEDRHRPERSTGSFHPVDRVF